MDKVKEVKDLLLVPQERKDDQDKLYGKDEAGTEPPKSPLAQGHIQDDLPSDGADISAPAELTGMTGQYITGRDVNASSIAEQELKKHGTATGLASATMASGAVGEQNPSIEQPNTIPPEIDPTTSTS